MIAFELKCFIIDFWGFFTCILNWHLFNANSLFYTRARICFYNLLIYEYIPLLQYFYLLVQDFFLFFTLLLLFEWDTNPVLDFEFCLFLCFHYYIAFKEFSSNYEKAMKSVQKKETYFLFQKSYFWAWFQKIYFGNLLGGTQCLH